MTELSWTIRTARGEAVPAADPHLYTPQVYLTRDGAQTDTVSARTGLRTFSVDPAHGLRVNGVEVLLRGACIHHDNGVIGAATLRSAEFRRVRLLKDAGYNAMRSAHNPASRHLLDACDQLGMYVVDELTDVWFRAKTAHDSASRFESTWPADAQAMIRRDRLHPSVIMYSIGNENAETATAPGVEMARRITDAFRAADPTRPLTCGINFMLNAVSGSEPKAAQQQPADSVPPAGSADSKAPNALTSTMINALANRLGTVTQLVSRLPQATRNTRQLATTLDVSGATVQKTIWRSTDAMPSWSWHGYEGRAAQLRLRVDPPSGEDVPDALLVWAEIADDDGTVDTAAHAAVELAVAGRASCWDSAMRSPRHARRPDSQTACTTPTRAVPWRSCASAVLVRCEWRRPAPCTELTASRSPFRNRVRPVA